MYEKDLRYHKDWNWLMPVIVKIQNLGYVCVMHGNYCNILDIESFKGHYSKKEFNCDCYSSSPETLISAVHWCVIKFIKWHNLKK